MKLLLISASAAASYLAATSCWAAPAKERPIDTEIPAELAKCDPNSEIHIHNQTEAKAVRQSIIKYLWADGNLPLEKQPDVSTVQLTPELAETLETRERDAWVTGTTEPIYPALVSRVEKLVVTMDFGFHSTAYLLYPFKAADSPRLLIVQQGHQGGVMDGTGVAANRALKEGFQVLLMQLPMCGWNTDKVFDTPKGKVTVEGRNCGGHNKLVPALEGQGGSALRFFVEPVIVCVNYFVHQNPNHRGIAMTGLSGGGWTTDMASAIDTRISLSIPVAGSFPLYMRRFYPGSEGDAEQRLPAMFEKTASYLDVYLLGGYGKGRKRIQVLNQFEGVFYGVGYKTYKDIIGSIAESLGGGECDVVLQTTQRGHKIHPWTIDNVIMPAIQKMGQNKSKESETATAG